MGKGSARRPCLVSSEEEKLRWDYYQSDLKITKKEFLQRIREIRKRRGLKR